WSAEDMSESRARKAQVRATRDFIAQRAHGRDSPVDTLLRDPVSFADLVKDFTKYGEPMERAYVPVLLLLGFVVANAVLMLGLSALTLRARPTPVKQAAYESGIPPLGDARERFSVKFYMVAVLFIIFDIETVFMIPWGAHFWQLSCAKPLAVGGACPAGQVP